jgi:hypothetical protein
MGSRPRGSIYGIDAGFKKTHNLISVISIVDLIVNLEPWPLRMPLPLSTSKVGVCQSRSLPEWPLKVKSAAVGDRKLVVCLSPSNSPL